MFQSNSQPIDTNKIQNEYKIQYLKYLGNITQENTIEFYAKTMAFWIHQRSTFSITKSKENPYKRIVVEAEIKKIQYYVKNNISKEITDKIRNRILFYSIKLLTNSPNNQIQI